MMKKRILIIGQCTLHWGRMEFGNIGNFYIMDPFFDELRKVFPFDEIVTTMQFSDEFCDKYSIETVPMELYYDFNRTDNLAKAMQELSYVRNGGEQSTDYIEEVRRADLVIDFSGDIWGDNADYLGGDRFATGCYKDLVAQALRPTVMLAGSPGPFGKEENLRLAKETYKGFRFVTNREPISTRLLKEQGFDISKTYDYPCPSFLFKPADVNIDDFGDGSLSKNNKELKIGFVMCGWNFARGPYTAWPRDDAEYDNFARLLNMTLKNYPAHIYLLSHSNGFAVPPKPFELIKGRDYPIVEQLYNILQRGDYKDRVTLLDGIYLPDVTKEIISRFDVLISGRMHGAVAGISQAIPTVIIDYGHKPKAHKLRGFSEVAGTENYIADPNNLDELWSITSNCIEHRNEISRQLAKTMVDVKEAAKEQFELLRDLI